MINEERLFASVDWAPSVPDSYALVHEKKRHARGYVRFRIRECIEVPECGAAALYSTAIAVCGIATIDHKPAACAGNASQLESCAPIYTRPDVVARPRMG